MNRIYYALGGGRGHLTRARLLRERLGPGTILHQAPAEGPDGVARVTRLVRPTPEQVRSLVAAADHLVVDTFPGGIAHELTVLPARATLVARHLQRAHYPRYDALVARFDEVLLPYDVDRSEWDDPPPGVWVGPVRRTLRFDGTCDLLVIGAGEPPSWTSLLASSPDRFVHRVDGPFATLPRPRAVVALSAGYNLFWELDATGIPFAARPLPRRFDDQFRRVGRFGTPLLHRADLVAFLVRHGLLDCPR